MKIYINNDLVYEVSDLEKKCLENTINKNQIEARFHEIVHWHIQSFCDQSRESLKKHWIPILFKRLKSIPTDDESLLGLIFSQSDYQDQYTKDAISKAMNEAKFTTE